jgi:uncharacterized phage infection (PIP) family protein YhgE
MTENCDKHPTNNNSSTNSAAGVASIIRMVEKMIADAVQRINDLRSAESDRINQMFSSHKEYFDSKFQAQKDMSEAILKERDSKLADKFESLATAINKAEVATEKRFEGVNEFRNTLSDQQKTFITSGEYKAAHQNLVDAVNSNAKTLNDIITAQKERIDKIENMKQGGSNVWILVVGIIGFATGLISFILNLLGK